jgi:hypothetical protein
MSDLSQLKNKAVADLQSAGSQLASLLEKIPSELQAEFSANIDTIKSSADTLATTAIDEGADALKVPTLGPIAAGYVVQGINAGLDELNALLKQVQPLTAAAA